MTLGCHCKGSGFKLVDKQVKNLVVLFFAIGPGFDGNSLLMGWLLCS
jgi:hypothetical protein